MSEQIPESTPLSADPRRRTTNSSKRPKTAKDTQANQLASLFASPDQVITVEGPSKPTLAPPPEIVTNVQGSSAGAGSGEFHVYKASRRREMERLKEMDDEVKKEKADEEWESKKREREEADRKAEEKRRAKRAKRKGKDGKDKKDENGKVGLGPRRIEARNDEDGNAGEGETGEKGETKVEETGFVIRDDDD